MSRIYSNRSGVAFFVFVYLFCANLVQSAETPEMAAAASGANEKAAASKPLSPPIPISIGAGCRLYQNNCAACHGRDGDGYGIAAKVLTIRPRKFRNEAIRYVSTDGPPSDDDFIRTVHYGRRNAQMPAFPYLMDEEILSLSLYIREMYRQGLAVKLKQKKPELNEKTIERVTSRQSGPGKPVDWQPPSSNYKSDTANGRVLFGANCAQCHGPEGHGDGQKNLLDSEGHPIKARDITTGDFHGGSEPLDLYFRIRCGIPGTPMPASAALSDDEVWQLVNYVNHLAHK